MLSVLLTTTLCSNYKYCLAIEAKECGSSDGQFISKFDEVYEIILNATKAETFEFTIKKNSEAPVFNMSNILKSSSLIFNGQSMSNTKVELWIPAEEVQLIKLEFNNIDARLTEYMLIFKYPMFRLISIH